MRNCQVTHRPGPDLRRALARHRRGKSGRRSQCRPLGLNGDHFPFWKFFLETAAKNCCALGRLPRSRSSWRMKRREAKAAGLARYSTGKPCKHGHLCERYTNSGHCVECERVRPLTDEYRSANRARYWANVEVARTRSREAHRRYRIKNYERELVRGREGKRRRYHEQKPGARTREQIIADRDARRTAKAAARESRLAALASDREARRLASAERARERGRAWRAANPDRYRDLIRGWKKRNRPKVNADRRSREIRKRTEIVADLTKLQRGRCAYCRVRLVPGVRHVDHIQPRARGGANVRRNLQLACAECNVAKGARDPIAFAQSLGRLL